MDSGIREHLGPPFASGTVALPSDWRSAGNSNASCFVYKIGFRNQGKSRFSPGALRRLKKEPSQEAIPNRPTRVKSGLVSNRNYRPGERHFRLLNRLESGTGFVLRTGGACYRHHEVPDLLLEVQAILLRGSSEREVELWQRARSRPDSLPPEQLLAPHEEIYPGLPLSLASPRLSGDRGS